MMSYLNLFLTLKRAGAYSEFRAAREKISEVSVLISYLKVYWAREYVKSWVN